MTDNMLLVAFNVIEAVGLAGALVIIITAVVSPSIQRLPTWYLVLCGSAVCSFSMLLLAMAQRQSGPEPDFALCLIQGALIYASPIWFDYNFDPSLSALNPSNRFHLTVLYYVKQYTGKISHKSKWLLLSTVILFILVTIVLLVIGILNPQIVQRDQFYCHFTKYIGVYAMSLFSIAFATIAVTFESKSGKLLYRHWKNKDEYYHKSNGIVSGHGSPGRFQSPFNPLSGVSTLFLSMKPAIEYLRTVLALALLSNIVVVLALNMSIIRAWMFWNNHKFGSPQVHVEVKVEQSV
ncbi:hypothetical protein BT96DRAFT_986775 [Gymnopus androsaceus JB14]|uniref:G-protein coupled receptors family 1 profile domain-containing protein n=1 Tax=Gymnopus androsaceus JB14 TaxID=1447944 RepID=A0A6A4ICY3_9AGAR|nr:hypothetical protein BT96DRAFT_986775 [Gymnopus androsaceus JB14]